MTDSDPSSQVPPAAVDIDHVILAVDRLEAGVEEFARVTGVMPLRGGEHPGRGTQNALVSLGSGRYLEIMASLPSAPHPAAIPFTRLTPAGWALQCQDLAATLSRLQAADFDTVGPTAGSRRRPDGSVVEWQTGLVNGNGLGLAPFLIEWAVGTLHPSASSPGGCRLTSFGLTDPDPAPLRRFFEAVGFAGTVSEGQRGMSLRIEGLKGPVDFAASGTTWVFRPGT